MERKELKSLTQGELIIELHRYGYGGVTKRRISDWRENDLLPPFDVAGAGRGRRGGRTCSSWSDGELIFNQALWVCKLLEMYRSFERLYLPLWMLGYLIPLARVREALRVPVEAAACSIHEQGWFRNEIEDVIDDVAIEFTQKFSSLDSPVLRLPAEALAAYVNLFFNESYDLTDAPFQDGVEALRIWDQTVQHVLADIGSTEGADKEMSHRWQDSAEELLARGPVIMRYFSLPQLRRAVAECSDEDLLTVERDLGALREVALLFQKMLGIVGTAFPDYLKPAASQVLPSIFGAGRLLILADLSLRRNGCAEMVDQAVAAALSELKAEWNEELERELAQAAPAIATALETCLTEVLGIPRYELVGQAAHR